MRFNLSTVILSLFIASSVIAAPAPGPNASELAKRSWLGDKMTEWFQEVKNSFSCGACVTGLVTVKDIAWLKRSWALDGLYTNSPATVTYAAPSWGDYNCDAPPKLATSMLDYVPSVANISFGIMTGDIPHHDAWLETPEKIIPQLKAAFDVMTIIKAKIYPAIGNHETSPLNDAVKSFKNYGSYTLIPDPGLRIVSLNTNFCNTMNFYLYGHTSDLTQNAVSTAWIGPSVTPYTGLNPAFRVYKVDTKSWNAFESLTCVADLDKSASWDATGSSPNRYLEYSARHAYSAYVPIAADQPLSAGWWHNVTNALESNPAAFKQYWSLRGYSANRLPECTHANGCVADIVCDLRASMRSEICNGVVVPLKKRDDDHSHDASAAGADMSPNLLPLSSLASNSSASGDLTPSPGTRSSAKHYPHTT
ncbi:hypothetical protein KI688_011515 [Linnemannia hyalina]|uniref:Sphingomyelin phosphodiesterase n=1 Tax=Linnemannia hyalina TaxID=64524 RepID=A0A9P7XV14_9FUNG|nr:hypothetical protein KI688_011515 [Linnemannia hyalina]